MKQEFNQKISLHGAIEWKLLDLDGNVVEHGKKDNLVVNVAKNAVAAILNGEGGITSGINYGAVGGSTATPAGTDTQLGSELGRVAIYAQSRVNNVISIEFYFDPTQANGALKEFGAFIDGTAAADSGTLFDRLNIDITKTSLNSLVIALTVTVS